LIERPPQFPGKGYKKEASGAVVGGVTGTLRSLATEENKRDYGSPPE